jgi:hypothetical protein
MCSELARVVPKKLKIVSGNARRVYCILACLRASLTSSQRKQKGHVTRGHPYTIFVFKLDPTTVKN